jgi:hypothetical protein
MARLFSVLLAFLALAMLAFSAPLGDTQIAGCANASPPFPGAECHEIKGLDGSIDTVFFNTAFWQASVDANTTKHVEWDFNAGVNVNTCGHASLACINSHFASGHHCRLAMYRLALVPGAWTISPEELTNNLWIPLVTAGTCIFAVGTTGGSNPTKPVKIGSNDAYQLLEDAVKVCIITEDVLEAQGFMPCEGMENGIFYTITGRAGIS